MEQNKHMLSEQEKAQCSSILEYYEITSKTIGKDAVREGRMRIVKIGFRLVDTIVGQIVTVVRKWMGEFTQYHSELPNSGTLTQVCEKIKHYESPVAFSCSPNSRNRTSQSCRTY